MTRPVRVRVSLEALKHNLVKAQELAGTAKVMAVVKADAYGHGAVQCAQAFMEAGAHALAVSSLEEARELREARELHTPRELHEPGQRQKTGQQHSGIHNTTSETAGPRQQAAASASSHTAAQLPDVSHRWANTSEIFLLEGPLSPHELDEISRLHLTVALHNEEQLTWLERHRPVRLNVWIKINTGMNRLGFTPEQTAAVRQRLRATPGVRVCGIMTHMARADTPDDPFNTKQLATLPPVSDLPFSIANSAALLGLPQSHRDWVRPGLMLYGLSPFPVGLGEELGLRPALALQAGIIAIHDLPKGAWLGYGKGFQAPRDMRIAVVAAGYGDGYPRTLGKGAPATINEHATTVLGIVSMDMSFIDITDIETKIGDWATLMGGPDNRMEALAQRCGTIPYELVCRMRARAPRQFV